MTPTAPATTTNKTKAPMTSTASSIQPPARDTDPAPPGLTGRYRRLIQRLGHYRWFAVMLRQLGGARLDTWLYRRSHSRLSIAGPALSPALLLTTTGRRTGKPRTTPVLYHRDGTKLIISSENSGQRRPAAWPLNLLAHPVATVQICAGTRVYTARAALPDEIDRYWPHLLATWPAHATYHRRGGTPRMFILEPSHPLDDQRRARHQPHRRRRLRAQRAAGGRCRQRAGERNASANRPLGSRSRYWSVSSSETTSAYFWSRSNRLM
jgi:deazaflavin-dependent oxidoreductase (nitroreductase family)